MTPLYLYPFEHDHAKTSDGKSFSPHQLLKYFTFKFSQQKNILSLSFTFLSIMLLLASSSHAQRKMENLGRGVVATRSATNQIFISWRLLGTEPMDLGFNVYRSANGGSPVKLNTATLTQGTNWTDATASITQTNTYFVKPVVNGTEQAASVSYVLPANTPVQPFFKVPINNTPGYGVKFIWVGDLDGDGEYDFVFDKQPFDESKVILLEAYKGDGTFLWQMDCGPNSVNKYNISPGSSTLDIGHGDNFTVYDITGDGKAEVIVRTANGVKFSNGVTVAESNNEKQFISVLNGQTGVEISRTPYNNPYLGRGPMNGHMAVAYLDGINPSIVWEAKNRNADDSFNEMTTAWSWNGSTLVQKWQFITGNRNCPAGHQIKIADVDGDGKDEIIPMGFVIDDDGTLLHSLGSRDIYHGDRFYVGDLDPARPGLEMYGIQQGYSTTGIMWYYCDAKTGELLLTQKDPANHDMGRGMTGDLDPRYPGYEFHTFVDALYNVSGAKTSTGMPSSYPNLRFWWDGDLGSENLDNSKFTKWNYLNNREDRLYTARNIINIGPNTPGFYGDILGDWREEVVYESSDHNSLTIFTTPYPTTTRIYTLPHNPKYRADMAVRGYSQSHMVDYYLGYGMEQPPLPPIQRANKYWLGNTLTWDNVSANWTTGSAGTPFANGDTVMFDIRGNNSDTIRLNADLSPGRIWAMNPGGKNYIISGAGKLTGPMDLIKAQPGNITLCGNHTYTGLTRISEGVLSINGSLESPVLIQPKGNLGGNATFNGSVTLEQGLNTDGGGLRPGNGNAANLLGTLTINGNLVVPGKNNFTFDVVPGSAKINDSIIVKGNLSFSGVNKLIVNFANALPVPGIYTLISCTDSLTASQENFIVDGFAGVPKELIIENNQIKLKVLSQRAAGSIVWKGSANNVWDFNKANFELGGTSDTFVSNDTVRFDESGLQKSILLTEKAITSGVTFDAASNYTISGPGQISGAGDLIKLNTDTVGLLSSNNTYTGKTIVNGGALVVSTIGSTGEPSSLGSADGNPANLVINNASLIINDFCTTNRSMTITGNTTVSVPTAKSYAIFVGEITGSGTLIKEGSGSLYLTRRNTFSGQTIIKNGVINLRSSSGNEQGLGSSGVVTIENATLSMEDVRSNNQARWNIIVPEGKNATLNTDGRCAMLGSLTGSGTLNVKTPYVRSDFKGNWSAFTGKINISGSDFRIANNFGYANASVNMVSGTAYTIGGGGSSVALGDLSGVKGSTILGTNWIIGAKNTDATFAGRILGTSLTKIGTGSLVLTDTCSYAGPTIINGGKLLINFPGAIKGTGAVTVNNGSILGGTGAVFGLTTINGGGKIAPGNNTIGVFKINNSLTFASGSTTEIEINKTANAKDQIITTGAVKLNGTLQILKVDSPAFVPGDNFALFSSPNITGKYSAIDPATPGPGLAWDTTALRSTGILWVKGTQNISFVLPANLKYGDAPFELSATGGSSGNPITFSIVSGDAITLNSNIVTILKAGVVEIKASQAGNSAYFPANDVIRILTIAALEQTISFTVPEDKKAIDAPFDLIATGGASGNPVTFSIVSGDAIALSGHTVTILKAGAAEIKASQAGSPGYAPAVDVIKTLTIEALEQTITFMVPNNKKATDAPFDLVANGGDSGNPVTFSVISGDAITISGSTVNIIKPGSVEIKASQAGDDRYLPALDVVQTLVIGQPPIASFTANPTSGYAPLAVSFDASATTDADNDSLTYAWNFGDGVTASGIIVNHTYLGPGDYTAVLTVEDSRGDITSDSVLISVASGLKAQYRARMNEINQVDNHIKPHFQIVNTSNKPVPYSELTLRYWFTSEGNTNQVFWCDYALLGTSKVKGTFATLAASSANADHYLEVSFTSAGSIAPGGNSGEIQTRFNKVNWSNYNEAGDYSYDPSKTNYQDWNNVTLYRKGVLFWGTEPANANLRVEELSFETNGFTTTVSPNPAQTETSLKIYSPKKDKFQIRLMDITGRTVVNTTASVEAGESKTIPLSISSAGKEGIYILKVINSENKAINKKIIKQ